VVCFPPPRAERQASASAIRIRERLSSGNPSTGLDSARANITPPSQNRFWYSIRGTCETSASSIRHSGHTGFLNHLPTVRFGHLSQYSPLHLGHCQAGALNQPPTSLPHLVQKPRTKHHIIWIGDLSPKVGLALVSNQAGVSRVTWRSLYAHGRLNTIFS